MKLFRDLPVLPMTAKLCSLCFAGVQWQSSRPSLSERKPPLISIQDSGLGIFVCPLSGVEAFVVLFVSACVRPMAMKGTQLRLGMSEVVPSPPGPEGFCSLEKSLGMAGILLFFL